MTNIRHKHEIKARRDDIRESKGTSSNLWNEKNQRRSFFLSVLPCVAEPSEMIVTVAEVEEMFVASFLRLIISNGFPNFSTSSYQRGCSTSMKLYKRSSVSSVTGFSVPTYNKKLRRHYFMQNSSQLRRSGGSIVVPL